MCVRIRGHLSVCARGCVRSCCVFCAVVRRVRVSWFCPSAPYNACVACSKEGVVLAFDLGPVNCGYAAMKGEEVIAMAFWTTSDCERGQAGRRGLDIGWRRGGRGLTTPCCCVTKAKRMAKEMPGENEAGKWTGPHV